MRSLKIEIHNYDRTLAFELYRVGEGESLSVGRKVPIAVGVNLVWEGAYERKSVGFPSIDFGQLVINGLASIPFGVVAAFIYDKLKERKSGIEKLLIGGHQVAVDEEDIERMIKAILEDGYEPTVSEHDRIRQLT